MYNVKSCPSFENESLLVEDFAIERFRSCGDIRSIIPQKDGNIVECKSVPALLMNEHVNISPKFPNETAKKTGQTCQNDTIVSDINEKTENNSKEKDDAQTCIETSHLFEATNLLKLGKKSDRAKRNKRKKRAICWLDIFLCMSVVGPLAIGFWRGVWTWMDLHAELFPGWFCFAFGAILHVMYAILKNCLHDTYMNKWTKLNARTRVPYRVLRILYIHTFGVACVTHWRGGWIIIDAYLFTHIWITTCLILLLLAFLAMLRCVRNLVATPMFMLIDRPRYVFQFPSRYNVSRGDCEITDDYVIIA